MDFLITQGYIDQAEGDGKNIQVRLYSPKPNRRGDVIVPQGFDTSAFERNPVLLYNHNK